MRIQFSLLTVLLATAAVGVVSWRFSPRAPRNVFIEKTGRPLDLAIVGEGYFEVVHSNGQIIYTRSARLAVDSCGSLVLGRNDFPINPNVTIPTDQRIIEVTTTGAVNVSNREMSEKSTVGRIHVSQFPRPEKLLPMESGCFALTDASGQAIQSEGGWGGAGYIAQGWLERDNAGFWSYENPMLVILGVIVAAIAVQTVIFGKFIGVHSSK
jgi:flagellar basal body rod protein FlgG